MTATIDLLRERYQKAISSGHQTSTFWNEVKGYRGKEGIFLAYKASALALRANHDWNPYNKLSWLNEAINLYREAVQRDPSNIEIRFLRFATQHNSPDFLNQNRKLEEDKSVFLQNLPNYRDFHIPVEQLKIFHDFFAQSKRFSKTELQSIKDLIIQNN